MALRYTDLSKGYFSLLKIIPGKRAFFHLMTIVMLFESCHQARRNDASVADSSKVRIMVLAPGHFHAALLQKSMYPQVDSTVYVYAPKGPEVQAYLKLIDQYNTRAKDPTAWKEKEYLGPGYLDSMLREKPGNMVVIAGNNRMKTTYIQKSVDAGLNVLADKPMAINEADFDSLKEAFSESIAKKVFLYDIMTERYVITNVLLKDFSHFPDVFGELKQGTSEKPAISFSSKHYFFKQVSGQPLIRPDWYFDVAQQGEGLVDVTTHLVDLIQWECFPETIFNYREDIRMLSAKHWATRITPGEFREVTGENAYPDFLQKDVHDSVLDVFANGVMNYTIKGIHARVSIEWGFEAPKGSDDTFYSMLAGTRANLVIRQGAEQGYQPVLYIEPADTKEDSEWIRAMESRMDSLEKTYPGISLKKSALGWQVIIPDKYNLGHEQHFSLVIKQYLRYLKEGKMPEWEISGMLAKYYTTTQALSKALEH